MAKVAIHHAVNKKAAKFGVNLRIVAGTSTIIARKAADNSILASGSNASEVLAAAIAKLGLSTQDIMTKQRSSKPKKAKQRKAKKSDDEDGESEDGEDSEVETRSIIKAKYKVRYRPHKMTNGDAIAKRVRECFMTEKDEDTKKPRLNFDAFVQFAKDNDVWVESYRSLKDRHGNRNNGMIRMNVINRLRGKIRQKQEIVWPK